MALSGQSGNLAFSWWGPHAVDQLLAAGRPVAALREARGRGNRPWSGLRLVSRQASKLVRQRPVRRWVHGAPPIPEKRWHPLDPVATYAQWREVVLFASAGQATLQPPAFGVWRSDPLSDPTVTTLALALPPTSWKASHLSRSIARRSAQGLVPDSVRLRTTRGQQSADATARVRRHADGYLSLGAWAARHGTAIDMPRVVSNLREGLNDDLQLQQWIVYEQRSFMAGVFDAWWRSGQPHEIPIKSVPAR